MKYNLNKKSSNFCGVDVVWEIIDEMILKFYEAHDIKVSATIKKYMVDWRRGLPELAKWMKTVGWDVEYWSLPDVGDGSGPMAYGLDFDDSCPLFMEARLKYS